jgi:hypothetical protein
MLEGAVMPILGAVVFAIDIAMAFHAAQTGRFMPWFYIILLVPGAGAFAYIVIELAPEWWRGHHGQQMRARIDKALHPEKTYRARRDQLEIADTISNREALAQECMALGRFEEARTQYDAIMAMPWGDEPGYMVGRARAEFALGRFADARATLDGLRWRWPDWQSGDGHLIYAKALEADGQLAEAVDEYQALSAYYAGAEPRVRLGLALRKLGREAEARAVLADVVRQMSRAPLYAQKVQAEWVSMAEAALRT